MSYVETATVTDFIAEARRRRINDAVIAWRREYGQVPDQDTVDYRRIELAWLLAYDRDHGVIIRHAASGEAADRTQLRRELEAAGFAVEDRCRNMVEK